MKCVVCGKEKGKAGKLSEPNKMFFCNSCMKPTRGSIRIFTDSKGKLDCEVK